MTRFFFNDTATTEIYTLSLHDALPIYGKAQNPSPSAQPHFGPAATQKAVTPKAPHPLLVVQPPQGPGDGADRKSTRLNSSHANISYAVFCLKKKTNSASTPHLLLPGR